jgi:ribosomal protein S28E/S33
MAQNVLTQIVIEALFKDQASPKAKEMEKNLQDTFTKLRNIAGGLGIALGMAQVVSGMKSIIDESVKLRNEAAALETAFRNLTKAKNLDADLMLGKMKAATRETVDGMTLMQQTNNALLLGLPVTEEDMALLAEAGYRLGKAMGLDAAKGLESLTVGIGRQSKLWLDNLGIIIDVEAATQKYAASVGKTVDELTEAEKKTSFYNAALESIRLKFKDLGEAQLDEKDKMQQATVAIKEAQIALGEYFAPAIGKAAGMVTTFLRSLMDSPRAFGQFINALANSWTEINRLEDLTKVIDNLKKIQESIFNTTGTVNDLRAIAIELNRVKGYLQLVLTPAEMKELERFLVMTPRELQQNAQQFWLFFERVLPGARQRLQEAIRTQDEWWKKLGLTNQQIKELKGNTEELTENVQQLYTSLDNVQEKIIITYRNLTLIEKGWKELELVEPIQLDFEFDMTTINQLRAVSNLFNSFTEDLGQALIYGQKLGPAIVASLKAIAAQLISKAAVYALMSFFTGGTSATAGLLTGGTSKTFLGYLFGGAFQGGGNPPVGVPYLVGERGPELRIDRQPGTILPNQIFNLMNQTGVEKAVERLRMDIQDTNRLLMNMKYTVRIGDKEIYASHEREAERIRRVAL